MERPIDANALHKIISEWPESVMYKDWVQSAIANAPIIIPLPNDPLSREQLIQMDGEPVFCVDKLNPDNNSYGIVCASPYFPYVKAIRGWGYKINHFEFGSNDTYGLTWVAYRRKPEEEDNETN